MRALDHPPSRFKARLTFDALGFLTSRPNMRRESKLFQDGADFLIIVALVQTHSLRTLLSWARSVHRQTIHGLFHQLHIMPIGPRNDQADRHAVSFGQQTAFDPAFAAVGRIGSRFFPHRVALSSALHPSSTSASPALSAHQTFPRLLATTAGTRLLAPTAETDHARWNADITRWRLRLPTDTRSAARRKSHRHTAGPGSVACHHQSDAGFWASAPGVQALPTTRRTLEILPSLRSPLLAFASFLPVSCKKSIKC